MALGRRGSRRIVVGGTARRWRLRGRPTYDQGMCWSPCAYAAEHADRPGTVLAVTANQPHPGNWVGMSADPVLPGDVARAIRAALTRGWTPERSGPPFHLDQSDGFVPWP